MSVYNYTHLSFILNAFEIFFYTRFIGKLFKFKLFGSSNENEINFFFVKLIAIHEYVGKFF